MEDFALVFALVLLFAMCAFAVYLETRVMKAAREKELKQIKLYEAILSKLEETSYICEVWD